jgi:taurine dioxygenase
MSASGIRIVPTGHALGARLTGVDFRQPPRADEIARIHAAWMEHQVLIFPEQDVSDAEHVAVSRCFGELEVHHQKIIRSNRAPEIFRVSNVDENDALMPPEDPVVSQVNLARLWHTDSSFRERPSIGSMLHGVEVSTQGGETCFMNMYAVLEALPESLAAQVRGRRARHNFEHLHTLAALKPLTDEERSAMPPVWQPMVRRHPVTGRRSLYISPIYNDEVEGLDRERSRMLIEALMAFAERDEFVYCHHWAPHDIVMWDNRCTLHRVTPHDPTVRRVMHRTTIAGDAPVAPG